MSYNNVIKDGLVSILVKFIKKYPDKSMNETSNTHSQNHFIPTLRSVSLMMGVKSISNALSASNQRIFLREMSAAEMNSCKYFKNNCSTNFLAKYVKNSKPTRVYLVLAPIYKGLSIGEKENFLKKLEISVLRDIYLRYTTYTGDTTNQPTSSKNILQKSKKILLRNGVNNETVVSTAANRKLLNLFGEFPKGVINALGPYLVRQVNNNMGPHMKKLQNNRDREFKGQFPVNEPSSKKLSPRRRSATPV